MAQVDTSIYNALMQRPKSVAEYDAEAMAGQQNKLSLQMTRAKMDEHQRGVERSNKLTNMLGSFAPGMSAADQGDTLTRGGFIDEGRKVIESGAKANKDQREGEKAQREAEKFQFEQARDQIGFVNQMVSSARDQGSYSQARQAMAARGMDVSQIPEQFDPAYVAQAGQQTLTQLQRIEQVWKEKGFDLDVAKFGETVRNNKEQTAVQIRGQNVTASTAAAGRAQSAQQFGARLAFDKSKPLDGSMKPMPPAALKMQQAELDAIGIAGGIQADLGAVEKQIKGGKLEFGPVNNLIEKGRNLAGMSNEASRNKASFKSTLEKLRNDSLRLNAGVQTDGDAQRAWNELFENINDKGVVTQRLDEIKRLNERAVNMRKMNVDGIRANYGRDPVDTTGYETQTPAIGGPVRVSSAADYAKLPSGAEFIDDKGQTRRKK